MWQIVLNLVFSILGIIGNLLCIVVLGQKSLLTRQKFNWYLLFQTLSDLLFLVIIIVQLILQIYDPNETIYELSKITCYYTEYIFVTSNVFSVLLSLILSIDRLYAIERPLHNNMSFTNRFPVHISISLFAILLVILHPKFFFKSYKYFEAEEISSKCHLINNKIYTRLLVPIVLISLPALVTLILNLILWFIVRKYARQNHQSNNSSSTQLIDLPKRIHSNEDHNHVEDLSHHNSTYVRAANNHRLRPRDTYHLVLIATNIVDLPFYCFYLLEKYSDIKSPVFETASNSFYIIGHSINIIVCLLFHKEFRHTAIKLLHQITCSYKSHSQTNDFIHSTLQSSRIHHNINLRI